MSGLITQNNGFQFAKSAAGAQINNTERELCEAGREKSRLQFLEGDNSFSVYALRANRWTNRFIPLKSRRFVQVSLNGTKYLLNRNSLRNRLGIEATDANETTIKKHAKLLKGLRKGFSKYDSTRRDQLHRVAVNTVAAFARFRSVSTTDDFYTKGCLHKDGGEEGHHFLLKRAVSDGSLKMFWVKGDTHTDATELGSGASGTVSKVRDLVSDEVRWFASKKANQENSRADNVHEWKVLSRLHAAGNVNGIIEPGLASSAEGSYLVLELGQVFRVNLPSGGSKDISDARVFTRANYMSEFKARKEAAGQVWEAIVGIHGRGIRHGDLKLENLLYRNDRWVIADFGAAHIVGEALPPSAALTPDFNSLNEAIARQDMHKAGEDESSYSSMLEKNDVFSTAAMVATMLTGKAPYECVAMVQDSRGWRKAENFEKGIFFPPFDDFGNIILSEAFVDKIKERFPRNYGDVLRFFMDCFKSDPNKRGYQTATVAKAEFDELMAVDQTPNASQSSSSNNLLPHQGEDQRAEERSHKQKKSQNWLQRGGRFVQGLFGLNKAKPKASKNSGSDGKKLRGRAEVLGKKKRRPVPNSSLGQTQVLLDRNERELQKWLMKQPSVIRRQFAAQAVK